MKRPTRARQIDRLWKPGDSIELTIGQGDMTVTPLQMARFYAMVANGGGSSLRTSSRTSRSGAERPVTVLRIRPADAEAGIDDSAALRSCVKVSTARLMLSTARRRRCSASSRSRSPARRERRRRSCSLRVREAAPPTSRGGAATRPTRRTPTLTVCVVIENGGHGGTAAAPAALKVFEHYFHDEGARDRHDLLRLGMTPATSSAPLAAAKRRQASSSVAPVLSSTRAPCVLPWLALRSPEAQQGRRRQPLIGPTWSAAPSQGRSRARGASSTRAAPLAARLDWIMLAAVAGSSRTASGGSPGSRATTAGQPVLLRRPPGRLRGIGRRRAWSRDPRRPGPLPPLPARALRGDAGADRARVPRSGRSRAARSAGSTSASSGSSPPSSGSC